MSRVQLALRVPDLEGSIDFYTRLLGVGPTKRRPGYANFAVPEPPLKLVLLEGDAGRPTALDHLGVEVGSSAEVDAATARLAGAGLGTLSETDTTCCYARQDKVWVRGPGDEPWEVYTVTGDSAVYGTDGAVAAMGTPTGGVDACCATAQASGSSGPSGSRSR